MNFRNENVERHLVNLDFLTFLQENYCSTGITYSRVPSVIGSDTLLVASAPQPTQPNQVLREVLWQEYKRATAHNDLAEKGIGDFSVTNITSDAALVDFQRRALWKLSCGYLLVIRHPVQKPKFSLTRESEPPIDPSKRLIDVLSIRLSRPMGLVKYIRPELQDILDKIG